MSRRVVLVGAELFFAARVREAAAGLGVKLEELAVSAALERMRAAPPDLAIADLQADASVLDVVSAARSDPATRSIEWVGFYSHVDTATRDRAMAAGVHHVMPRSAFTRRLADLLRSGPGPA